MISRLLPQKNATSVLVGLFLPFLLSLVILTSCSTGNNLTVSPTPTLAPAVTGTVTPPSLPRGKGEVLYLTNKSGSIVSTSGTFYASKPYTIFVLCTGSGMLTVQLTPGGSSSFHCSQPPQLQGNSYGDAQHPPTPEQIQIQVTAEGKVVWEISIHLQE